LNGFTFNLSSYGSLAHWIEVAYKPPFVDILSQLFNVEKKRGDGFN
jgi:hypothetical protein